MKDLYLSPGNKLKNLNTRWDFQLTLFTRFVFACCVVISPIRLDLSDFLYPSSPRLLKRGLLPSVRQANQVNKVKCLLLKIPATVYLLKSIT